MYFPQNTSYQTPTHNPMMKSCKTAPVSKGSQGHPFSSQPCRPPTNQRGLLQTPQTRNISKFLEQPAICFQDIHTVTSSSSSRNLSNKEAEKNQLYLLRHQSKMPESKREKHKINSTEENSENPICLDMTRTMHKARLHNPSKET